jgi:hypothetical protein
MIVKPLPLRPKRRRNPRRAYTPAGRQIPPMTLGDMRGMGIRHIQIKCRDCRQVAALDADGLPAGLPVADVALQLHCSACGAKNIDTAPGGS